MGKLKNFDKVAHGAHGTADTLKCLARLTKASLCAIKNCNPPIVAMVLWASWIVAAAMTGLLFLSSDSIISGTLFTIALGVGSLCGMLFLRLERMRFPRLRTFWLISGGSRRLSASCGCALLATLITLISASTSVESDAARSVSVALAGGLAGASLSLGLASIVQGVRSLGIGNSMLLLAVVELGAVLVVLLLSWLVSSEKQLYAWGFVLVVAVATCLAAPKKGRTLIKAPLPSDPFIASLCNDMLSNSRGQRGLLMLSGLCGFLEGFLIGLFPLTLHFSGFLRVSFVGTVSGIVLVGLFLAAAIEVILYIVFSSERPQPTVLILLALVLLAVACLTMPSMSTDDSSLFAVLFPLPTVLLLGIYSALAKSVLGEEAFRGVSLLFQVGLLACCGFVVAAILAFAHIYGLEHSGASYLQLLPVPVLLAALTVAIMFIVVMLGRSIVEQADPIVDFSDPIDLTNLLDRCKVVSCAYGLTRREEEILGLLVSGRNGSFIQSELHISPNTFKTHSSHIYRKLGVSTRQELLDFVLDPMRSESEIRS